MITHNHCLHSGKKVTYKGFIFSMLVSVWDILPARDLNLCDGSDSIFIIFVLFPLIQTGLPTNYSLKIPCFSWTFPWHTQPVFTCSNLCSKFTIKNREYDKNVFDNE